MIRADHWQIHKVTALPDARPAAAGIPDGAMALRERPDRDRASLSAIIVVLALTVGAVMGVVGSSTIQAALRAAGLAGESAVEAVQRRQAAAISQLDRTVQALNAALAGLSAHADFAGHREEAATRRMDKLEDNLGTLRTGVSDMRAAQDAAEETWRKPMAQLAAAVTKSHSDMVGLRASLDQLGTRQSATTAVGARLDRLERAMVQHNLLGPIRGSIQETRRPPAAPRETAPRETASAEPTTGHIISLTPETQ